LIALAMRTCRCKDNRMAHDWEFMPWAISQPSVEPGGRCRSSLTVTSKKDR
jgi:hypothetical protein